ncbi:MAG: hypothetical protein HYX27_18100 [Acidobacteria bacterium]|nr:hypothetical protein [Acidobacteriota bacterium]
MVFEVLFFVALFFTLLLWLFARDAYTDLRRVYRARRVTAVLRAIEGKPVAHAESILGPPDEIVSGSGGRSLYEWKGPATKSIPAATMLLIVTVTVDAAGIVTHAAWEER